MTGITDLLTIALALIGLMRKMTARFVGKTWALVRIFLALAMALFWSTTAIKELTAVLLTLTNPAQLVLTTDVLTLTTADLLTLTAALLTLTTELLTLTTVLLVLTTADLLTL